MIPRSSLVDKNLAPKIRQELSFVIDAARLENDVVDIPDGEVIVTDSDISGLQYSQRSENRQSLADDLRLKKAISEVEKDAEESGDDEFLLSIDDFVDRLNDIVVSSSKQKHFIAKKLHSFAPLIRQLRDDGVAWQKVKLFNQEEAKRRSNAQVRGNELSEIRPGDEFRGILRALIINEASRDQLEMVLNKEALRISEKVRSERLRSGSYVPLMVIGAGVHSAIFTSELLRTNPDLAANAVVIEPRKVLGGQFRAVGGAGFAINSRTRRHFFNDPEKNLPGKEGNINSFGDSAVLQLPDVENRIYSDNATLGLVAAMNSFLSADTALGLEVTKVSRNPAASRDITVGKYVVELRDPETNERITIYTDSVVGSTGLGESYLPFDTTDEQTQEVLDKRKEKLLFEPDGGVPGLPKVATAAEFWEFGANARNWQPITQLAGKEIVIVGDGDSTQTILERLHGILQEASLDTMTSQGIAAPDSDKPIEVTIIGSKQGTYTEYIAGRRVRYHFVALQFPREDMSRDNDTITPIENKAQRLIQGRNGKTYVTYTDADGVEKSVSADLVITGTGFRDKSREIFADFKDPYSGKVLEKPDSRQFDVGLSRVGTVFSVELNGTAAQLTILNTGFSSEFPVTTRTQNVTFFVKLESGISLNKTLQAGEFRQLYSGSTSSITFADQKEDIFQVLKENARPIGRQIAGEGVFIVGVAGKDNEFSQEEKESYPDATKDAVKILVNTDAIWRLSAGTALMAQKYVLDALVGTNWVKKTAEQEKKNKIVPEQFGMPRGEKPKYFVLNLEDDKGRLPVNSDALNILTETLSRKLSKWSLDMTVSKELRERSKGNVTLQFVRTYKDTYAVVIDPPLYPVSVLQEVFADLSDPDAQELRLALKALLGSRGSTDGIQNDYRDPLEYLAPLEQKVVNTRPRLSLRLRYDGKKYNFTGMDKDELDVLEDAPSVEMKMVGFSRSNDDLVKSELFGGLRVRKEVDKAVREALLGKPKVQEKKTDIDLLREKLKVTADSEVTYPQAKELFAANALTFENFMKLITQFAKRQEASFAFTAFEELFKRPFILSISRSELDILYQVVVDAALATNSQDPRFQKWNKILTLINNFSSL